MDFSAVRDIHYWTVWDNGKTVPSSNTSQIPIITHFLLSLTSYYHSLPYYHSQPVITHTLLSLTPYYITHSPIITHSLLSLTPLLSLTLLLSLTPCYHSHPIISLTPYYHSHPIISHSLLSLTPLFSLTPYYHSLPIITHSWVLSAPHLHTIHRLQFPLPQQVWILSLPFPFSLWVICPCWQSWSTEACLYH